VDAFALDSQRKAAMALEQERFVRSVVPVVDPDTGVVLLDRDEFPRPTTLEGLATLPAAFAELGASVPFDEGSASNETFDELALRQYSDEANRARVQNITHVHTAGNSSGIADGASVVLITSTDYAAAHGLRPRARIRAMATAGSDPILMLTAPTPVSRRALAMAGMTVGDIDLWEINEAFATVPLKTMRDLGIDPTRVNVNGGAIALGHPLGATGSVLLGTALDELEARGLATALVTLCIAGGQGIAAVIERV
jgi:acetyl-CoA C-acetyltransferase